MMGLVGLRRSRVLLRLIPSGSIAIFLEANNFQDLRDTSARLRDHSFRVRLL